jgi:DNA (cytosine-5)-methyltransferase 1
LATGRSAVVSFEPGIAATIAYAVENHPADSRVDIDESGTVQTLTSRMGTGGGNVPMVIEPFCKSRRAQSADDATTWKHGDKANTLNTFDVGESRANEVIVESIPIHDQATRFSGKRGHKEDGKGNGLGVGQEGDPMNTLTGGDRHAVAYQEKSGSLCARDYKGVGSQYVDEGKCVVCFAVGNGQADNTGLHDIPGALNCMHDQQAVVIVDRPRYIVRRLTPTECARLQGFPDRWGDIDHKETMTDEDYAFWLEVRQTYDRINGRAKKDYTEKQILAWYNKLHNDGAEYKMWGNGIALPCALYVMEGIVNHSAGRCSTGMCS